MAKQAKPSVTPRETRQAKVIKTLKEKENWMKWGLVAAIIVILLLLLFIGYATDWTRGIKTTSGTTPLSTELDGATTGTDGVTNGGGGGSGSSGSSGSSGGGGASGTNGTNGTNGTGGTSTTTNNTTSTTNNTTTTNPPATTPPTNLYDTLNEIYSSTGIGANLNDVIDRATAAGIDVNCTNDLLLRSCTLTVGDQIVTVRGLLSTGLVTSILQL